MAKFKRTIVGSVLRAKDEGSTPYIKILEDVRLAKGSTLRLENKKSQLESLNKAVENGKMGAELAAKITENINKIPDFVLFQIVQLEKND